MLRPLMGFILCIPFAHANILWPELFISDHIFAHFWSLIIMSLLVEWPFIKKITKTTWLYAFILTCMANLLSMSIGQSVFIIAGLFLTIIVDSLVSLFVRGLGTFSVYGWIAAGIFLAVVNTVFELGFLILLSKIKRAQLFYQKLFFSKKNFYLMFSANFLSAFLTLLYMYYLKIR